MSAASVPETNPWARSTGGPSSAKAGKKPATFAPDDEDFGGSAAMATQQQDGKKSTLELLKEAVQTTKETEELGMATLE